MKFTKPIISLFLTLIMLVMLIPTVSVHAGKERTSTSVVAGIDVTFVIKADNSLWAWGANNYGQLGDGTDKDKSEPVKIMDGVKSVYVEERAHSTYAMAIKTDNTLWAWGSFNYGQFGDGTTESRYSPVKITDNVSSVSFGESYTLILKTDGSLWGTGTNIQGQLGDGTTKNKYTPVKIMDGVVSYSAGYNFAAAVKKDGTLWGWGANPYGTIGTRDVDQLKPVKIMDGVASVSVNHEYTYYALAIKKDGSLWSWGDFKVSYNTRKDIGTPIKVMDNVLSVAMGKDYAMAIKTDNSLWSWGYNTKGELGNNTKDETGLIPVKVMDGVSSVSLSGHGVQYTHVQAIKTDGSLWAWGSNEGKLGDGTLVDRYTPVKVMDGVIATSSGSGHGVAVKSDGSLWSWGNLVYNPSIELQQVKKVETTAKYYDKIYAVFSERRVDTGFVRRYLWTEEYAAFGDNKKIYEQAKSITAGLTDDYARARAIYDWVCKNITYDVSLVGNKTANSALTVLRDKKAICDGYTNLTEALLRAVGISSRYIASTKAMNHAWNEAFIDGRWIIIDSTWGSTGGDSAAKYGVTWDSTAEDRAKKVADKYFDPLLEEISKTHEYSSTTGVSRSSVTPMKMMDGVRQ